MSVRKDPDGHRWVQAEVEVPGSPEEVWQAIATGPGISSWFVPTVVEEREGGAITASFGPGMDSAAVITAWEPPHRFVADSQDEGPESPTIATEWVVEAEAGGTCVVRVVHRWFAESDAWDDQFGQHEQGWRAFFRILRLYLEHFRGQSGIALQWMGMTSQPVAAAWTTLTRPLGLEDVVEGQRVVSTAGAPALAGVVEHRGSDEHPELLLRLDTPAPGLAHLFAADIGGGLVSIRYFLFGEEAQQAASREDPIWQAWLAQVFPPATGAEESGR